MAETGTVASQFVCRLNAIPEGEARGFDMNNEGESTIFLVKRNGEIFAYYDICPHYGRTRLAWKKDAYLTADGSSVQCSAHGAKFRISDGVCKIGPCMGQRLTSVAINIRDGAVWIEATHRESL